MEQELETLLAAMVKKVRSSHKDDPAKLVGALQAIAKSLSRAGQFKKADPLLEESLVFHRESLAGKWQTYYLMALAGQNKIELEEYESAKKVLTDAHEGLRKTKAEIGESCAQRNQQVVDWLIELAEKTGNDSDLKKWQTEKSKTKE